MLTNNELDNMILHNQLNKEYPHRVNIQYGLDINKVKGINNFPVYNESKEFISHAKPNTDSFMFHSNDNKYNVGKATHQSIDNIEPYYYNKNSKSSKLCYGESNKGLMSRLYGLPPDRNIILENPTAQAMNFMGGQITEKKIMVHNWGKNEVDSFMNDPRVSSIVNGTPPITGEITNEHTEKENNEDKKYEIPKPRAKTNIIVEPAFPSDKPTTEDEFKTPLKTEEVKTPQPTAEQKDPKKYESVEKIEGILKSSFDNNPKGKSLEEQQKIIDILKKKGYTNLPHASIKINSTFANKVRKIIAGTDELTPNEKRIFKKLITLNKKGKVVKKLTEEMGFEKEG